MPVISMARLPINLLRSLMNHKKFAAMCLTLLGLSAPSFGGCTFHWQHYGPTQNYDLIKDKIGSAITDEYCRKYNSKYEIVIMTDSYVNSERALAHVSVGLRKRGSNEFPANRFSAYKFEDGNFVIAKGYSMASALAIDTVMDVMSDLKSYTN